MVDNKKFKDGNIAWEESCDNIILVDPNKIYDKNGQFQERLVEHENLVMYANLEARIIPRTKLAVGENFDELAANRVIANFGGSPDGKINFLKPQGDSQYFDTSWSDQLTGQGSLEGRGINQTQETKVVSNNVVRFPRQILNKLDTQLLGITNIKIENNTSFIPLVKIDMVDVQGRTLFEQGENSPYSAFLQLPYPLFYLTVKGFYGKAVRYELMLKSFNARFDPQGGNYIVNVEFIGRTAAILSDVPMGSLYALPHMYNTTLEVQNAESSLTQSTSQQILENANNIDETSGGLSRQQQSGVNVTQPVTSISLTRGYQKISQAYQYYKSKGLINKDFPELTLSQLKLKLDGLEKYITQTFSKQDLSVLNDIDDYREFITLYRENVYGQNARSWFQKYVDGKNVLVTRETGELIYQFQKKYSSDLQTRKDALVELNNIVEKYNDKMLTNATFGTDGTYQINGKKQSSALSFDIDVTDFTVTLDPNNIEQQIDINKSIILSKGISSPTTADTVSFLANLNLDLITQGYKFDSQTKEIIPDTNTMYFKFGTRFQSSKFVKDSFLNTLADLESRFGKLEEKIERQLSDALLEKIESSETGLGFKPTIRNIMAVIMASVDGFYSLMDDVHTNSWALRADPVRLDAVLSNNEANGVDTKDSVPGTQTGEENFIYPWPQYFESQIDENGNSSFVLKYIGDPNSTNRTKGYLYDKWPEVEFVEEYITGALLRQTLPEPLTSPNQKQSAPFIPNNAIEFPYSIIPYGNTSAVPFYYEIFERTYLATNYSNLFKTPQSKLDLFATIGDFEAYTIKERIASDPFLMMQLKRYGFNFTNFIPFLQNISNDGKGESWALYERDYFVTPYIRNYIEKDSAIYSIEQFNADSLTIDESQESENNLIKYLKSSDSSSVTITDTYPFTSLSWLKSNMAYGVNISSVENANDTTKSLYWLDTKKSIVSFNPQRITNPTADVPLTTVTWKNTSLNQNVDQDNFQPQIQTNLELNALFLEKTTNNSKLIITESVIDYGSDYEGSVLSKQTTSLLNTPYFVNAIIEGVNNLKSGNQYPYKSLGYLFLNSLPISTLREKSLSTELTDTIIKENQNNYLSSIFNKVSAVHKLPYAFILKYGSIWHRYKTYVESNTDILDGVWKSFDYSEAYDPTSSAATTTYQIKNYSGLDYNFNLNTTGFGNLGINIGMYPELINAVNYMFNEEDIIKGYSQDDWTEAYNNGLRLGKTNQSSVFLGLGSMPTDPLNTVQIRNWYSYIKTEDYYLDEGPKPKIIVIPSTGGLRFSQYKFENSNLLLGGFSKTSGQIENDQTLYDGSVRTLWNSSNYGYYDNSLTKKPTYNEYLKIVDPNKEFQNPFDITYQGEYSNIEELFGVFTKQILDDFETEFLRFVQKPTDTIIALAGEQLALDFFTPNILSSWENRNIIQVLNKLFVINDLPLTGDEDKDGPLIAEKQLSSFAFGIDNFLAYQVIFKRGNPTNFNRRVWNSFSTNTTVKPLDPVDFGSYVTNSLPSSSGGITLAQSQSQYSDAWQQLKLNVGEYKLSSLQYKNSGSFITDFFIDFNIEFTANNVIQLAPIIKMYATQKVENGSGYTPSSFLTSFNTYLSDLNKYQSNVLNHVFRYLNQNLPNITEVKERRVSALDGEVAKIEIWETFKAMNDKWIAGGDFKNRSLFEDFMFLDRANRDIGDKLIVDVTTLTGYLSGTNDKLSVYSLIGELLSKNNLLFMALPSYVNFYGVQQTGKGGTPTNLDIPNSAFGTYLEVDYQQSKPKFICLYTDKLSEHTQQKNNIDYRFNSDSFDIGRCSDNPLRESNPNKDDYGSSNKVVAFNVDFGIRNQNMFKSINLNQSQYKNTSETFSVLVDIANQNKGQKAFQQSTSLYNLYKTRSYTCDVESMGNAMLQPTMYFNLRYVPMFTGAYWITSVVHTISPQDFTTSFSGVRISKYAFPNFSKLTMSVNTDLLRRYQKKKEVIPVSITAETPTTSTITLTGKTNGNVSKTPVKSVQGSCKTSYPTLPFVDAEYTLIGKKDVVTFLNSRTDVPLNIKKLVFAMATQEQNKNQNQFGCVGYDLYGIHTDGRWPSNMMEYVIGQECVKVGDVGRPYRPLAIFSSYEGAINFVLARFNTTAFNNKFNIYKVRYGSEGEAAARIWLGWWNLGVGMKRPGDGALSAEQRITEEINKRISQGLPWTVTVGIFESAIKRAKALGLN